MGNWKEKILPILVLAVVGLAFLSGTMWSKIAKIEKGAGTPVTAEKTAAVQPTPVPFTIEMARSLFKADLIKFGDGTKKLLFIEVSDPSCPYCGIASGKNPELYKLLGSGGERFKLVADGGTYVAPVPEMKKLVDAGKADYVWIYYPGHNNGEMATRALYCSYEKGKFWPVHDLLATAKGYELINNTVVNEKSKAGVLADFLKSVVNPAEMKSCLESDKYDARLKSDAQLAVTMPFRGTPNFFVNTTNFAGAYSFKDMQSAVDGALK